MDHEKTTQNYDKEDLSDQAGYINFMNSDDQYQDDQTDDQQSKGKIFMGLLEG